MAKAALLDKNDLLEAFKLKHERELQTEMWAAKRKEKLAAEEGHAGECLTAASSGTKPGDSPGATADDASPDPPMHAKLVRESTAALDDHDDGKLDEVQRMRWRSKWAQNSFKAVSFSAHNMCAGDRAVAKSSR